MSSTGEHVVDRLSSLPQDVLSEILSLMPIKFAVRTSLLSKIWRYTWTLVHNFDFKTTGESPEYVDWVLEHCKTSQVKIFRVLLYSGIPDSYCLQLISKVIGLNVRELDIKNGDKYLSLPLSLFTCKTLTKLKLASPGFSIPGPSFSWQSFVHLPNLKTLDVVIYGKYWENALKLIHGCPVLENLYVEMMGSWKNKVDDYYFKIPTLKRLNLKANSSWENALKLIHGCPVLENLYVEMMGSWKNKVDDYYFKIPTLKRLNLKVNRIYSELITHTVVLNFSNLEYFLFEGCVGSPFVIEEMPSLIEAKASCAVVYHGDSDRLVQLLKGISQAKSISLKTEDLSGGDEHLDLPKFFPNLKQLELEGYVGHQWNLIPQFLERSPKLEHLYIGTALHDYRWNTLKPTPTCMRVNLKTVKYKDGCGYHDLEFLKFILSNSKVLKMLTVECDTKSSLILRANLTKLRKASIKGEIRLRFLSSINKTRPELTESRDRHFSETFCTTTLADHMNTAFRMLPVIFSIVSDLSL